MGTFWGLLLTAAVSFLPPLHLELLLAGNFGEPRPNHFHGGIDIKTSGVEGKPVFSIGNGYIERVSFSSKGYGLAIYIRHPEGYISVYGHLQKFLPEVESVVEKWQEENGETEGTIYFKPSEFPVQQDQLIAYSGNTGGSFGPHLHLEIRDAITNNQLDPLDFIGEFFSDTTAPHAESIMLYPLYGVVDGSPSSLILSPSSITTAWGYIGVAISADDFMEGSKNRLGVRLTELYLDDKLVFRSDISNVSLSETSQINSWGDFDYYLKHKVWYLRSYIPSDVTLPILESEHSGIININEERPYHFTYVLSDYFGNTSRYTFTIEGHRQPSLQRNENFYLSFLMYLKINTLQLAENSRAETFRFTY